MQPERGVAPRNVARNRRIETEANRGPGKPAFDLSKYKKAACAEWATATERIPQGKEELPFSARLRRGERPSDSQLNRTACRDLGF